MYASVADVTADVDIDEAWAIATYKDTISENNKILKRLGMGATR